MNKLETKYIICYKNTPSGEWAQYIALDREFDTEEQAVLYLKNTVKNISKNMKCNYFIMQVKRFV